MSRSSKVVIVAAFATIVFSFALLPGNRQEPVSTYRAGDFARMVYQNRSPKLVRVLLQFDARPTDDPLVWDYRPSTFGTVPPSIRFHFSAPPVPPVRCVEGTVSPFKFDLSRRPSNLPGIAVLTDCRAVE